jgi:phosphate:Na+ symporter
MSFGLFDLIKIVGSLCFFIFGMKMMSEGIQRAAGDSMRNILRNMTKNRFLGVFTGFLITALVQSSSATTVMTVSFVNAGLLSLAESAGVLMGANIGTTITAWLVSIFGFEFKVATLALPLFAVGVPLLFTNKPKLKYWGEFILGFSILMFGLEELKDTVPTFKDSAGNISGTAADYFRNLYEWAGGGLIATLLFVFVGTMLTIVVQSSSAAMAMTLTLCANGLIPFDIATAMVLGENIGTTITAQIAALVGNFNAKRSARIHAIFNIIGVMWMIIILPWFSSNLLGLMDGIFKSFNIGSFDIINGKNHLLYAISAFHTSFNLINVFLMIWFVPYLVKMATYLVKDKDEEEDVRIKFINNIIRTPELAIDELHKETAHFGEIVSRINSFCKKAFNSTDLKERAKMLEKIKKYEIISDEIEIEITEYITNLSGKPLTPDTSIKMRSYLNICNDLERIGDVYFQMASTLEHKFNKKIWFNSKQRNNLNEIFESVDKAFEIMNKNLNSRYNNVDIEAANKQEQLINSLRNRLRKENNQNIESGDYNVKSALIYNNLFSSLERVGDHIINVSESVVGEI